MSHAIASGTMVVGLLSIPFRVYVATSSAPQVSFNLLHAACGSRVRQQYVCPKHERALERSETVRGFEYSVGHYVTFTEAELAALEPEEPGLLEIVEFVPAPLDPVLVEKSYFIGPDKGGERACRTLVAALGMTKTYAVGRYAMKGKEQLVAIRASGRSLVLHHLYEADELRKLESEFSDLLPVDGRELELAAQLISRLYSAHLDIAKHGIDGYRARVRAMIDARIAGGRVVPRKRGGARARILDVAEGLAKSVGQAKERRRRKDPRAKETAG